MRSGREERIPYSFSRWTDVCGSADKWAWFLQAVREGKMVAFDPRNAIPYEWSLKPEDTLGLVFWTKDPRPIIKDAALLNLHRYNFHVHVTVTGWQEVEKGAPTLQEGKIALALAAHAFGPENVSWRFSPVPIVPDVVDRFDEIAELASAAGIEEVYLSFLQANDRVPETRDPAERVILLSKLAKRAEYLGMRVLLCNEDRLLAKVYGLPSNLSAGVCAPPEKFKMAGSNVPPSEGCG